MPVITAQLDMAQPLHPGCARLQAQFGPPAQVWVAHTADELLSVLAQVEAAARAGAWCLGAVAYEAAAALEADLPTQPATTALAWFAQFAAPVPQTASAEASAWATPLHWNAGQTSTAFAATLAQIHADIAAGRYYQLNLTQTYHGTSPHPIDRHALFAALQQAQPGLAAVAMRENAGITREGMQQAGATTRTGMTEQGSNTRDARRNALTAEELALRREAQGFQTREAQQKEQLRNVLLDPKSTPEQRAVAQRNMAALSGKTAADRMQTVTLPDTTNEMGQVVRGGQALVRVLEDGTVQQVPIGGNAALPPMDKNNQAIAIRDNKSMSREQKVEALRKLGYQG